MKTLEIILLALFFNANTLLACGPNECSTGSGLTGLLLCCGLPILIFMAYSIYNNFKNKKKQGTDC